MGEKRKRSDRHFKFETTQLHGGQEQPDPSTGARSVPIYQTSSYVFDNCDHAAARFNLSDPGNIYSRLTNPTLDVFEQRMAQLEGGVAALATASGAAALSYTFQNLTRAGDHIVSSGHIYGGTYNYLAHTFPEYGVETTFVDPADLEAVEAAIRDNTKAVFIETLGNPNSDIADIEKIASIAHRHQIPLVIDNTFATPYLVRPIEYGADIVVHSATKFTGGHGTAVGGVIVDGGRFDWAASKKFPGLSEPNASYHGIRFAQDVGAAAFVTRIRELDTWVQEELVPKAKLAARGEGSFIPGDWCRFCKARNGCRARAERFLKLAQMEFQPPALLTEEEIAEVLLVADELAKWAADVYAFATDEAITRGKQWTGFKLVEGRSNRKYTDEELVAEAVKAAGYKDIYKYGRA